MVETRFEDVQLHQSLGTYLNIETYLHSTIGQWLVIHPLYNKGSPITYCMEVISLRRLDYL